MAFPTIFAQLGAAVITWFGIPKLYLDTLFASKNRAREDYHFAKEYLADLHGDAPLHPFLRERACYAITGNREMRPCDLEYLLSLDKPTEAMRLFSHGKGYVELCVETMSLRLAFKAPYRSTSKRWRIKAAYFLLYAAPIFSFNAIPTVSNALFADRGQRAAFGLTWFAVGLLVAFYFLYLGTRLSSAERLITAVAETPGKSGIVAVSA